MCLKQINPPMPPRDPDPSTARGSDCQGRELGRQGLGSGPAVPRRRVGLGLCWLVVRTRWACGLGAVGLSCSGVCRWRPWCGGGVCGV